MKPSASDSRPTPRPALLTVATALVLHCGVLLLGYRAVPASECLLVVFAVIFVQACALLQPRASTPPPVRPLGAPSGMGRTLVRLLLAASGIVSFVLPWTLILWTGDAVVARVVGPQLFVFATQQLFEIWSYRSQVPLAVRVLIPVGFVAYRLKVIATWIGDADAIRDSGVRRAAQALGVANIAFCAFVLFYVLLLRVCPPYFARKRPAEGKADVR